MFVRPLTYEIQNQATWIWFVIWVVLYFFTICYCVLYFIR